MSRAPWPRKIIPWLPTSAAFAGRNSDSRDQKITAAAKLSTAYIFPSTAEELAVLRAVLRTHPSDTTAHYLLGTLYFSRGLTDSALEEWSEARKLGLSLLC